MQHRGVRALVVDDSPAVRSLLSLLLRKRFGFIVTEAASAPDAWELFINQPQDFDCVFLDFEIGWDSGGHLLKRMLQVRPQFPALMLTGSPDRAFRELIALNLCVPLISKPFQIKVLQEAIEELGLPHNRTEQQEPVSPLDQAKSF